MINRYNMYLGLDNDKIGVVPEKDGEYVKLSEVREEIQDKIDFNQQQFKLSTESYEKARYSSALYVLTDLLKSLE